MDGLLTTIIAGVVVTVIGGIVAFYFGGVREKQRQREERQREEQDRQRKNQRELGERRLEALDEIQSRAESGVEDLRHLAERVSRLGEEIPDGMATFRTWALFFDKYEELAQQSASISSEMASLRAYYQKQALYFESTTRAVFESFDKEFEERYRFLSRNLYTEGARKFHEDMKDLFSKDISLRTAVGKTLYLWVQGISLGYFNHMLSKEYREYLQVEFSVLHEGIESIREWDFAVHNAAFDAERERIASALP
jgi:hypothetical protein